MSIYTKTGDDGMTTNILGQRVSKASPEIDAGGCIDELSAFLGFVRAEKTVEEALIFDIQKTLLTLGGELAKLPKRKNNKANNATISITPKHVQQLEQEIDRVSAASFSFRGFIIPGDNRVSALLHVARTVCRRAERSLVHWNEIQKCESAAQNNKETNHFSSNISPIILQYLNRLSDLLFVLACRAAQ
ncbi:MAG: cob(I)yrinic acid a,c-diamide adenosyltransferase [Planctomycetaceae bacterium]|jgi:cob(I)alamin adenosyltransferase|nr:cob(I)yrinic acid a,c-diamide adenosyltransferase [Planctomycetaceae bacterium]